MPQSMKYVLVTGTNGGLGLGICTRLLDDFLQRSSSSSSLTLIFTTRSSRKGNETLHALRTHLSKHHPRESTARIHLQPENVELTNLLSVRALSQKLLTSDTPYINAIIPNAGIGGWSGLNWPLAFYDVLLHMVTSTTWPRFKLGIIGLITGRQFPEGTVPKSKEEPPLGQIFCANVFGHYMLIHWLMPLLCACEASDPGRIIWVSSIEPHARHFKADDMTGLRTDVSYESSKRLTDLLALTSDSEAARHAVRDFTTQAQDDDDDDNNNNNKTIGTVDRRLTRSTPSMYVAHPGICTTSIVAMYWILQQGYVLAIHLARLLGSPWATASTYVAAMSFTWLTLAPKDEIEATRRQYSPGGRNIKWGSSATRLGKGNIRPTEVDGWGINGSGEAFASTWWAGRYGRAPGATDATREDVDKFVATGGQAWREMESMRKEWEDRLDEYERAVKQ